MKETRVSHHAFAYFLLILVLAIHVALYFAVGEPNTQFIVVASAAIFYVGWSMIHHAVERTLSKHIVLEYGMIAALAVAIGYVLLATR